MARGQWRRARVAVAACALTFVHIERVGGLRALGGGFTRHFGVLGEMGEICGGGRQAEAEARRQGHPTGQMQAQASLA